MSPEEEKVKEVMDIVYGKDAKVDSKPEAQSPQLNKNQNNKKEENNIPKENYKIKENELIIETTPHIKDKVDTKKIMWNVVIALIPTIIASIYFFKLSSVAIITSSVLAALATEYVIQKLTKKKMTIKDGSAVITGLLLALILPPTVPLWIPILGSIFAISIGKLAFGGLGHNIFNPALAGRVFLVASWPALMTKWITPDSITAATPLGLLKQGATITASYSDMFFGNTGGCIGEVSAIALLIGAAYLFYKKIIDWKIPATYIGTVIIISIIFRQNVLLHILSGGLLIGAFFMATDYVTSPVTKLGKLWFGFGCGFLTIILRLFSGYPEGVMFSILLMNAATPLIERFTSPKPFGFKSKKEIKKQDQEEKEIKKKVDEMLK